jgi:catalase
VEGVSAADIKQLKTALAREGARMEVIAKGLEPITCDDKSSIEADKSHLTAASVFYDAVFVAGGAASVLAMAKQGDAIHFVQEAFRHCKTLAAIGEGVQLLVVANLSGIDLATEVTTVMSHVRSRSDIEGVVREFVDNIKRHRHFDRADKQVTA